MRPILVLRTCPPLTALLSALTVARASPKPGGGEAPDLVRHHGPRGRWATRSCPPPTVTFSERLTIRPGGRAIELHYLGPSHTENLVVPFLPDVGVAFAVDFVFNDRVGWCDLLGWDFAGLFRNIPRPLKPVPT